MLWAVGFWGLRFCWGVGVSNHTRDAVLVVDPSQVIMKGVKSYKGCCFGG